MTMKHLAAALAALALALPAVAQTSQKISAGKSNEYGLVYSLPKTALDIYIEAEITDERPGEFYNYARRHLGITDAITAPRSSAVVKDVIIVPRGVADPDNRWVAQFKNGSSVFMNLTPENLPLSVNTDAKAPVTQPAIPVARPAEPSPLDSPEARQAVTQDMARSSATSKKAELAAQRIFELRETRSDILSGQAENPPADGNAMKLVLDNLAAQEAALTAMFAGVRQTRTEVRRYSFEPDSTDVAGEVVARLSAVDGLIEADNLAGSPITLDISVLERGELPVDEKGVTKTFPKGGVAYNIPGTALVSISWQGRTVASAEVPVAQLGVVFGLNPTLFTDKKEPYSLIYDPTTGAAVKLEPAAQ